MYKSILKERIWAVERYLDGDSPESICSVLGHSKQWLYKWLKRHDPHNPEWFVSLSRSPCNRPHKISQAIEDAIKNVRVDMQKQGLFCGAQAILWEMEEQGITPLPSLATINRVLKRSGLTRRRVGPYQPKGKRYPMLEAITPNQVHQMDLVGPRYLDIPLRFYSMNAADLATGRCAIQPLFSRSAQCIIDSVWDIWWRMGISRHLQVDNDMTFFGSNRYPRGMGCLIRLCLNNGVDLWFIPPAEPWRNGVVEKMNHHYQQKMLRRVQLESKEDLVRESRLFETKHNERYRYSKLNGKTPMQALAATKGKLRFPEEKKAPRHNLPKPEKGHYHFVRFIRSDRRLNIFSEHFIVPEQCQYEYVIATIDVKEQRLKLIYDRKQVAEYDYKLR